MSYCALVEFRNGKADTEYEYRNSWGGSARIWDSLFNKFLKDPNDKYDCWLNEKRCKVLWKLVDNPSVPLIGRIVLAFTFDYAIVKRDNFKRLVVDLREFDTTFPTSSDRVNHLPAWASLIEKSDAEAIGCYGTSVSEDLWFTWDDTVIEGEQEEDSGRSVPYDLNTGDKHFEIYDEFGKCTE
jgi:hypothetical protein